MPTRDKKNLKTDWSDAEISPGLRHGRSISSHNFDDIDKSSPEQVPDSKAKEKDNLLDLDKQPDYDKAKNKFDEIDKFVEIQDNVNEKSEQLKAKAESKLIPKASSRLVKNSSRVSRR